MSFYKIGTVFLFIVSFNSFSQTLKNIKGKITANFEIPEGVHISNKAKGFFTVSDNNGFFFINATINDTIVLTAVNIMDCSVVINKENYELGEIFPLVKENTIRLEEVTLKGYQKMDLVKMGVVSKNVKEYTPAERRLRFSKSQLNGLVNTLNGSIKYRKRELEFEKRNILIEKVHSNFEDIYFINELKIPSIYINGFIEFCIDDTSFVEVLNENHFFRVKFLFIDKAREYLKFIE